MELLITYQCDLKKQWVPYQSVLEEEPWLLAQYVVTNRLKYKHNTRNQLEWAKKYIKSIGRISLRHFDVNVTEPVAREIDPLKEIKTRRAYMVKHMHGIPLPCSARQGLELDKVQTNHKWRDAMAKEISLMKDFKVFEPIGREVHLSCSKGWQYAPLHWVFAVKNDLRHKARLVIGGHVTNADELDKCAATTSLDGVKLQLYLTARSGKKVISGDIGCAYLNSYTKEKIWTSLGPEFGEDAGRAQVIKSLYGLITSAHAWYEIFTSAIRDFGFRPSKIMPCLWYKLAKDGKSYDYLSHHVDDFLHTSDDYEGFLTYLRKKYTVTGGVFPDVHLGMNIQT